MAVGGGSPVPVLVDTGSAEAAVCPGVEVGSAMPSQDFGCAQYGGQGAPPNGWVGQFYNATVVFGRGAQSVVDPSKMSVAVITSQNTDICTANVQGIVGVNYGLVNVWPQKQPDLYNSSSGNLCGDMATPSNCPTSWTGCNWAAYGRKKLTEFNATMQSLQTNSNMLSLV